MADSPRKGRTSLMTPAQHREWARILREEFADDPEMPYLARQHEQIARAIEKRDRENR